MDRKIHERAPDPRSPSNPLVSPPAPSTPTRDLAQAALRRLLWRDSAPRSAPRSFLAAMLPRLSSGVDAAAALEGPPQRDLVGVLQVAADRQAAGQPRDGQTHRTH